MTDGPASAEITNNETPRNVGYRFPVGHPGMGGRPKKGTGVAELLRKRPLKDKKALVEVAYREALKGDVHWAEWIVKHSGESGFGGDARDGLVAELIIRQYAGWPEKLQ